MLALGGEAALKPANLVHQVDRGGRFCDCCAAERGIQFFIASHSYFVVKALYLAAQRKRISIPVLSSLDDHWASDDLQAGMPDNPIIDESIRLYEQEVELTLG
ncbi:hypothetical protein [Pseudomonas sp. MWU13-2105]|uniref:hypothetical protein n=1 Tax=Pseudomonas sp. MWU13-2105 TaxID=2935074 RepID=UPI002010983D|nr:hypothetical protein [Pseudomonas sp. MWU13-2105]